VSDTKRVRPYTLRKARRPCAWPGCERTIYHRDATHCKPHRNRLYKKAHREQVNASNRRYNARKPAVIRRARANWRAANPAYAADASAARRARKRGQFVEKVYRSKVLRLHSGRCGICGDPVDPTDFHVDHVIPLARGGEHSYANTQPAHPPCNLRKAASLVGAA
jgi:5-methylcytosine-specific restriction endonuclease McrA